MEATCGRRKIALFRFTVIASILLACSSLDNQSGSKIPSDTLEVKTLLPPKADTIVIDYITQDSATSFVKNSHTVKVSKKAKSPFNTLRFNKVVAYDYDGRDGEKVLDIITFGKLAKKIIKQKGLTQDQVDDLTNYLGSDSTYGRTKAFCFNPHLGIVFYKGNKVVAHVSICLECNSLSSSLKIPATEATKIKIGDDFEYPAEGFSKLGRQKILSLCEQLNFSHCKDTRN